MNRFLATLLVTALAAGCSEAPPKITLRSLQNSGEATFVCRAADKTGRPADACPDFETLPPTQPNRLLSLVTQTNTGEVAVIDINLGEVVDVAPTIPGTSFLRVGARPGAIVTTPGGAASFVGAAEIGKPGIYALPTTCLGPPGTTSDGAPETERDLTTWPACSLPAAPGDMAVLIDPPSGNGEIRISCDGGGVQQGMPIAATRLECAADLTAEGGPPGRRKLAVALPDLGEIAVIDAQSILDRDPGSFGPCEIERRVPLAVDLPPAGFVQTLPPDLTAVDCPVTASPTPPRPPVFTPRPAGFALAQDRLYIGDQEAPVIHVLDVSDACMPLETAPLLPASFVQPDRVVTTTRLAVSPVTPSGQQFVYAIDEFDQPAASIMAFDVSPGSADRTPIVRSGSPRLPFEVPDRIGFAAPVRDVAFTLRDLPQSDPLTGAAPIGTACDPNRESTGIGTLYRPNADYSSGARPVLLRGVFGFALLTSGQIVVIDTEDFDAPCRRPISGNAASEPDFRGCANDPATSPTLFTLDDTPATRTVTGEVSCSVVRPHQPRSAALAISSSEVGIRAPSLRSFPVLTLPEAVATRPIEERPRMLAVNFPGAGMNAPSVPAQVNVGTTLYEVPPAEGTENPLNIKPNTPDQNLVAQNSLVLPLVEPRSYPANELMSLSYEGTILPSPRLSGFLHINEASGPNRLVDTSLGFCNQGVYDVAQMRDYGENVLLIPEGELEQFAIEHADYVQITGDFPAEDDSFWTSGVGAACGRDLCETTFGPADASDLLATRELRVLRAFQDRLEIESRSGGQEVLDLMECCFPAGTPYTIRVSRQWALTGQFPYFRHDIEARPAQAPDVGFQCVRSCDPRRQFFRSRAFEISSDCPDPADGMTEEQTCRVGPPQLTDSACQADGDCASGSCVEGLCAAALCVYDQATQQVGFGPDEVLPQCIVNSLTAQFALYRGRCSEADCQPSVRGMAFSWETVGGFIDLRMSLTVESTAVLPQSMQFVPSVDGLAVVDGGSTGLSVFNLDTLGIARPSPFF